MLTQRVGHLQNKMDASTSDEEVVALSLLLPLFAVDYKLLEPGEERDKLFYISAPLLNKSHKRSRAILCSLDVLVKYECVCPYSGLPPAKLASLVVTGLLNCHRFLSSRKKLERAEDDIWDEIVSVSGPLPATHPRQKHGQRRKRQTRKEACWWCHWPWSLTFVFDSFWLDQDTNMLAWPQTLWSKLQSGWPNGRLHTNKKGKEKTWSGTMVFRTLSQARTKKETK